MELFILFLCGITIVSILSILDRFFSSRMYSSSSLLIGRVNYKYPLRSILIPLLFSFILSLLMKIDDGLMFLIPGFVGSFLYVWPNIFRPELIPSHLIKHKLKLYYFMTSFIIMYSCASYLGGLIAIMLYSENGLNTGLLVEVYFALGFGAITLISRKFVKL